MKSILIFIAILSCAVATDNVRTTRKNLHKQESVTEQPVSPTDSVCIYCDSLIATGYDKPLRSSKETLFVRNTGSRTLKSITVRFTYLTTGGTVFHMRTARVGCSIAAGQQQQISFKAWDVQQAYYFIGTRVTPRSPKAIPYRIATEIVDAVFD